MPHTILLVDDDREFRSEFKECLEHYKVIEAAGGTEALSLLRKPNEIDLVILDVMLPGASGTDVLKEMKKNAPDLKIVMLTGYSSKDVAIEALKGRADEYIEKPLDIDKTKEIIERLLTGGSGSIGDSQDIHAKIERAKQFARRNAEKKTSLNDVARTVCLSPKYLSRIFKEHAGVGFNEYKLQVKVRRAQELLTRTGLTVDQISYRLGYRNPESFIRIFEKFTRLTPTQFRTKRKKTKKRT